jgi:hypothetical protein
MASRIPIRHPRRTTRRHVWRPSIYTTTRAMNRILLEANYLRAPEPASAQTPANFDDSDRHIESDRDCAAVAPQAGLGSSASSIC